METGKRISTDTGMGSAPVGRTLLTMAGPMMLSMLGQALYNVVDTFFVSHIADTAEIVEYGEKAVNALTLAYPVQILMIAFGVGTGVGINSVLARFLGRKDRAMASTVAGNAILVSFFYVAAFMLFGVFGAEGFIATQTSDPQISTMAVTYLRMITIGCAGTMLYMCYEKIVMATGRTRVTMICQLAGAGTNILLDPLLIYGLLGAPALAVSGAALATVLGQFVSLILIVTYYYGREKDIGHSPAYMRPDRKALGHIFSVGLPAILMQLLTPVMSYGLNLILGMISTGAITAYGVFYKLQNFVFMPAYGLNNASIPLISYNRGAGNRERVRLTVRYGLLYVTGIMAAGLVLLETLAPELAGLFGMTAASAALTTTALRVASPAFLFAGVNIILQGVCQSMGRGNDSLAISLIRMILVPLPLAWWLSTLPAASSAVWFALPAGELAASAAAVYLTRKALRM